MKTDAVGGLAGEVKPPRNEPLPSPGGVLLALIGRYDENVGRSPAAFEIKRPLPVHTAPLASIFSASGEAP